MVVEIQMIVEKMIQTDRRKVCIGLRIAIGITMLALLLAGGAEATKFINANATGGDCASFGIFHK